MFSTRALARRKIQASRDHNNEAAVSDRTDCIVSGNADLLSLNPFRGMSILNAADFVEKKCS